MTEEVKWPISGKILKNCFREMAERAKCRAKEYEIWYREIEHDNKLTQEQKDDEYELVGNRWATERIDFYSLMMIAESLQRYDTVYLTKMQIEEIIQPHLENRGGNEWTWSE